MNLLQQLTSGLTSKYPKCACLLTIIGLLLVSKRLINLLITIYKMTLRRRLNFKKRYGHNSWAFVTGSSQGIGKAFAIEFAKEGFNVILCARTLSKLQKAKQEILEKYPQVQVEILPMDFKRILQENYLQEQLKKIEELDISVLINNVGADVLDYYTDLPLSQIQDMIKVNCFPIASLTHHFLPIFHKRYINSQKRSSIINVSSMAGQIPMPLHNIYSASKSYGDFFSRAISYQSPQLDIISLRPSEVSTTMTMFKQKDILTIQPQDCAMGLMNDLGYQKVSNGYWTHQLQGWLYQKLPEQLFNYVWIHYIGPEYIKERRSKINKQQLQQQNQPKQKQTQLKQKQNGLKQQ